MAHLHLLLWPPHVCAQACSPAHPHAFISHTDKTQTSIQRKDEHAISTLMCDSLEGKDMHRSYNMKMFASLPGSHGIWVSNDREYLFLIAPLAHA